MKAINANRKSLYTVRKFKTSDNFTSVASLRAYLATQLEDVVDIGYIEPGHGMKGRQVWLLESNDLISMYTLFMNKKEIILWCHIQKGQAYASADVQKDLKQSKRSHYLILLKAHLASEAHVHRN